MTQSMHSSDIETLTVITPRAEQLSNERLMRETYTCTLVCVLYMCMGVHVYIWDMLMYTSIRHACTCSRVWDVHVHLYMHWPCMCTRVGETNITCVQHVCIRARVYSTCTCTSIRHVCTCNYIICVWHVCINVCMYGIHVVRAWYMYKHVYVYACRVHD